MSMQDPQQHPIRGTLTRHLETRTHQDFDIIVVGSQTLFVPAALYAILDELTCGDLVEAVYGSDSRVVWLRRVG